MDKRKLISVLVIVVVLIFGAITFSLLGGNPTKWFSKKENENEVVSNGNSKYSNRNYENDIKKNGDDGEIHESTSGGSDNDLNVGSDDGLTGSEGGNADSNTGSVDGNSSTSGVVGGSNGMGSSETGKNKDTQKPTQVGKVKVSEIDGGKQRVQADTTNGNNQINIIVPGSQSHNKPVKPPKGYVTVPKKENKIDEVPEYVNDLVKPFVKIYHDNGFKIISEKNNMDFIVVKGNKKQLFSKFSGNMYVIKREFDGDDLNIALTVISKLHPNTSIAKLKEAVNTGGEVKVGNISVISEGQSVGFRW